MKKIVLVVVAIFAIDLCVGQDLKVVGGKEKNINVQRGKSEWFDVSFKNMSNKTLFDALHKRRRVFIPMEKNI